MKLLTFLARRFAWQPHAATLPGAEAAPAGGECTDCVVAFVQAEARDEGDERWKSTQEHARKHVEWLARKRDARTVVLHSFAHLGGTSAAPEFGERWLRALAERLVARGYAVRSTPFGWTNPWQIDVEGDAIAKVWKEI